MKNIIKNIIKICTYIVIILSFFKYFTNIYAPFDNFFISKNSGQFYRYKNGTIDVIYLGPSGIYSGISPISIYKKYGFTGFDISIGASSLDLNYFQINNLKVNKKQNIKILMLDSNKYFANILEQKNKNEIIHRNLDFYHLNKSKIDFVNEQKYNFNLADKTSYIIPFFSYHDMWNKPINRYFDFARLKSTKTFEDGLICAGAAENCKVKKVSNQNYMQIIPDEKYDNYRNNNYNDFLKIKRYCDNNNIKLILITTPDPSAWNKNKHDIISKLANDNNLEYLDFNTMYDVTKIDMNTDFFDGFAHLNINGQTKLSNYIGQYLKDNYNLEDHRGNPKYKQWDEDLEEYKKYEKIWFDEYNKNLQKQQSK